MRFRDMDRIDTDAVQEEVRAWMVTHPDGTPDQMAADLVGQHDRDERTADAAMPRPSASRTARWPLQAALELGALPTAPGCGRAWIRQILWEWQLTPQTDNAELIASELLANASLASRTLDRPAVWLALISDGTRLVISVRDFAPGAPAPRHASDDDESGRGLMLVEAISDRFGWGPPADGAPGKVAWAVLVALCAHR